MSVYVTRELLESGKSKNGGWSRRQLEIVGVMWPLKKGWRRQLHKKARLITESELAEFVSLKDKHLEE